MHNAPSVSYPVGRSAFLARAMLAGWLGAVAVTALSWPTDAPPWRSVLAVFSLVLPAVLGWRFWRQLPRDGQLRWDGQDWHSPSAPDQPAALHVQLDGQRHMLVRLQLLVNPAAAPERRIWQLFGARGTEWLWLEATGDPDRWPDLRRAAFARSARVSPTAVDSP